MFHFDDENKHCLFSSLHYYCLHCNNDYDTIMFILLLTHFCIFSFRAVAGVIVANDNEGNIISFMDFQLEPLSPNNFEIHDCNTKTRMSNSYYILDAKHGTWPVDTFCRAFMKKSLPGDNYVISAELFITEKRSDGNFKEYFGLAFNVKDMSKYDFVFVR